MNYTVYPYPSSIIPAGMTWRLDSFTSNNKSLINGTEVIRTYGVYRWKLSLTIGTLPDADARKIIGFFSRMSGGLNLFSIFDFKHRYPSGEAKNIYDNQVTKPFLDTTAEVLENQSGYYVNLWDMGFIKLTGWDVQGSDVVLFKKGDNIGLTRAGSGLITKHIVVGGKELTTDVETEEPILYSSNNTDGSVYVKIAPPFAHRQTSFSSDIVISDVPTTMFVNPSSLYSFGTSEYTYSEQVIDAVEFLP